MKHRKGKSEMTPKLRLPPFEEFRQKFLQAFGRELTREERRFYRLITIVLEEESPKVPGPEAHGGFGMWAPDG